MRIHRPKRSGISLLEVMFSVGVVVIGLLGVALLLPLAGRQAQEGAIADRGAAVGKMGVEEFGMRGMQDPNSWRLANGLPLPPRRFMPATAADQMFPANPDFPGNLYTSTATPPFPPAQTSRPRSFCIDPRFVAVQGTTVQGNYNATRFPYGATNAAGLWMHRITLRAFPRQVVNYPLPPATWPPPGPMTLAQANRMFISEDDLQVILPRDRTLLPIQEYGEANSKRQAAGTISWMATLVPKLDYGSTSHDQYTLSVVVFNRRDAALAMDDTNERVAYVERFFGLGIGGGEVRLVARGPGRPAEDLDVREGDWLMLSGQFGNAATPVHKWYRVGSTSEPELYNVPPTGTSSLPSPPAGTRVWSRLVSLSGGDWAAQSNPLPTDRMHVAQATIVSGVIQVMEKTVRLEGASLWD